MTTLKVVTTWETQTNQELSFTTRFTAVAMRVILWPVRAARTRKVMHQLTSMNEHQLRDIGLTRDDIISAQAVPLDQDPTYLLASRAQERAEAHRRERLIKSKTYYGGGGL
jgi:uncharacterized protein YjiS (DUF1127 family)